MGNVGPINVQRNAVTNGLAPMKKEEAQERNGTGGVVIVPQTFRCLRPRQRASLDGRQRDPRLPFGGTHHQRVRELRHGSVAIPRATRVGDALQEFFGNGTTDVTEDADQDEQNVMCDFAFRCVGRRGCRHSGEVSHRHFLSTYI